MTSQRFSLKGWNFKTWVGKNKESLKLLVSGLAGLLTGLTAKVGPERSVIYAGIVAAVAKILLDTLDYWQSE